MTYWTIIIDHPDFNVHATIANLHSEALRKSGCCAVNLPNKFQSAFTLTNKRHSFVALCDHGPKYRLQRIGNRKTIPFLMMVCVYANFMQILFLQLNQPHICGLTSFLPWWLHQPGLFPLWVASFLNDGSSTTALPGFGHGPWLMTFWRHPEFLVHGKMWEMCVCAFVVIPHIMQNVHRHTACTYMILHVTCRLHGTYMCYMCAPTLKLRVPKAENDCHGSVPDSRHMRRRSSKSTATKFQRFVILFHHIFEQVPKKKTCFAGSYADASYIFIPSTQQNIEFS